MTSLSLRSVATPRSKRFLLPTTRPAPFLHAREALPIHSRAAILTSRWYSDSKTPSQGDQASKSSASSDSSSSNSSLYGTDWEDDLGMTIESFEDLPHRLFGANQHMIINYELKEALRLMLRQFNAPIVYCFAYGSGVFPQESAGKNVTDEQFRAIHPRPPDALVKAQKGNPKMIDFIFGVTHTQHWHSINMRQHRNHYSGIASLGSGAVSHVQNWGAGVYFNPFVEVNGMLIKYGVTSIDNLVNDLSTWDSLYLAGRLHKPVKILRDHPQVRLANQHNLIAAVRTALLLLPADFTEAQFYSTIAGLSYLGDPRMALPTENKSKVTNIVDNNIVHFRRLYAPLISTLPNVDFTASARLDDQDWVLNPQANNTLQQDMNPQKRSNMVRRLPKNFRSRLYFQYQKKFSIPRGEFDAMMKPTEEGESKSIVKRHGGEFERRIATDDSQQLHEIVRKVIEQTVHWPSTVQSAKGILMGGIARTVRYMADKISKYRKGKAEAGKQTEEKRE